jgi:hypothetical protein
MPTFLQYDDAAKYLAAIGLLDSLGGLKKRPTQAKTGNYTVAVATDPSGTVFTNRGAGGAVTFTLPAPAPALDGYVYEFVGVANQNIAVAGASAGQIVTFNNAAAASVTCSTSSQKIGAHMIATCDGTSWWVNGDTVGVTYTVA